MTAKAQTVWYIVLGVLLASFGVVWALWGATTNVGYDTVEGISVFAALYVIAQAAERVTEWTVDGLSLIPASPEKRKEDALLQVRAANSTLNGNPTLADFGPQLVDADRANIGEALNAAVAQTQEAATKKQEGEANVNEARRDIKFLAGGLSVTLCALAVNGLNYGLLDHIGAKDIEPGLDRLVTVLAAAGGTKALHELIGRVQKAKESTEAGARTT